MYKKFQIKINKNWKDAKFCWNGKHEHLSYKLMRSNNFYSMEQSLSLKYTQCSTLLKTICFSMRLFKMAALFQENAILQYYHKTILVKPEEYQ